MRSVWFMVIWRPLCVIYWSCLVFLVIPRSLLCERYAGLVPHKIQSCSHKKVTPLPFLSQAVFLKTSSISCPQRLLVRSNRQQRNWGRHKERHRNVCWKTKVDKKWKKVQNGKIGLYFPDKYLGSCGTEIVIIVEVIIILNFLNY